VTAGESSGDNLPRNIGARLETRRHLKCQVVTRIPSVTSAQVTLFARTGRILLLPSGIATRHDDACPFLYISNRTSLFDTENPRIKCLDS